MSQQSIEEQIKSYVRKLNPFEVNPPELFLLPLLMKAIRQRDASLELLSPGFFNEGQIERANKDLIQLLETPQKESI